MHIEERSLISLYEDGLPISQISIILKTSEENVLSQLKKYRDSQFSRGRYSEELARLVESRDSSGAKRKDIMNELGVSRNFMVRAISDYGFLSKMKEGSEEHFYMDVDKDFKFEECPKCASKRINDIQNGDGEVSPSGIYCMSCGSEFTLKDNIVNIIKWEYVN